MKAKLLQIIITLTVLVQKCRQQSCTYPFTAVSSYTSAYCVKCDSSCKTCFSDSVNSCVTCVDDFTIDSQTAYCVPPTTALINTV